MLVLFLDHETCLAKSVLLRHRRRRVVLRISALSVVLGGDNPLLSALGGKRPDPGRTSGGHAFGDRARGAGEGYG